MTGIRKNGVTNQEGKKSMALQFISGNSISDRTAVMYETICAQACRHPDKNYIFAGKEKQSLEVFGRNLNQSGFIQELKSVISEFSAYKVTSEVLEGVLPTLEKRPALQKSCVILKRSILHFIRSLERNT